MNLHDIYKGNPGAGPVFELHKSDPDRKINVFQLIIQLEFIDKSRSQKFPSPSFNLRTEVREDGRCRHPLIAEVLYTFTVWQALVVVDWPYYFAKISNNELTLF